MALEDDSYYWFLHPLFEQLQEATGQYIDLYGNAVFDGEGLTALEMMLRDARTMGMSQLESGSVHVGIEVRPVPRELYKDVSKEQFLTLLDQWEAIVKRARAMGGQVVCFGD